MALLPMPRLLIGSAPFARAFFYQAGTSDSTPKQAPFTDQTLAVAHPNPVTSDAFGLFPTIYLDDTKDYKISVYPDGTDDPPLGMPIYSVDNLQTLGAGGTYTRELPSGGSIDADAAGQNALILVPASGAPATVALYSVAGREGRLVTVKKTDTTDNVVTVEADGAEQIDGAGSYELELENAFVTVRATPTEWIVVAAEGGSSSGGKRTLADRLLGKSYVDDQWVDKAIDGHEVVSSEYQHYSVGSGREGAIVHEITVTNTSASTRTVRVYIGTASGVASSVLDAEVLPGDTISLQGPILMATNAKILASSPNAQSGDIGLRASVSELKSEILDVELRAPNGVALGTSYGQLYSCPAAANHATIESIIVCNTSGSTRTVDVEIRPSGGSAQTYQRVLSHKLLKGDTVTLRSFTLDPGDRIYAKASQGSSVGVKVSAVEWS